MFNNALSYSKFLTLSRLSVCLSVCLSFCLSVCLSVCLLVMFCLSVFIFAPLHLCCGHTEKAQPLVVKLAHKNTLCLEIKTSQTSAYQCFGICNYNGVIKHKGAMQNKCMCEINMKFPFLRGSSGSSPSPVGV